MAIHLSSNVAGKIGYTSKGKIQPAPKRKLTSCFFKNNDAINKIYKKKAPVVGAVYVLEKSSIQIPQPLDSAPIIYLYNRVRKQSSSEDTSSEYIKVFQKALSILVPELQIVADNAAHDLWNTKFTNQYDEQTESFVREFQRLVGITVDGIVGPETIDAMDRELEKIKYYDCGGENGIPRVKHNASICEDRAIVTRVYHQDLIAPNFYNSAFLYSIPDTSHSEENLMYPDPLPLGTKVYVIQDINNYQADWLYVQVDMPLDSNDPENQVFKSNRVAGYVYNAHIWTKSNMPDHNSLLYKVKSGDSVYELIKSNYYTEQSDDDYKNDLGNYLRTETSIFWDNEYYYQFKFYVNLLLYANNNNAVNYDDQQAIFLTYNGTEKIEESDWGTISDIHPLDNPDSSISNYQYFLNILESHQKFHWEYPTVSSNLGEQNTIQLIEGKYIWIPSRRFADHLYAYINNRHDYFKNVNQGIRNFLKAKWERGFGVSIEGSLGATLGINLEPGGSVKLYRKFTRSDNEIVMCLSKSGRLKAGVGAGIGAGFFTGSGTKKGTQAGLGGTLEAQANLELECSVEYEFPLYDTLNWNDAERRDLPGLALFAAVSGIVSSSAEFIGITFTKLFTDYNIDPSNYLTKLDIHLNGAVSGSASGMVGFRLSDNENTEYWNQADNNDGSSGDLPKSPDSPPWHIRKLLGLANAQLGMSAGAEACFGYEYSATYIDNNDDECFDKKTGARVPKSFTQTVYTTATLLGSASGSMGLLNATLLDISPYVGLKLGFDYQRPNTTNRFIPSKSNITYKNQPIVTAFSGNGNWDSFDGKALEYGIALVGSDTPYSISSLSDLTDLVDYIYLKKRFSIVNLKKGILKTIPKAQSNLRDVFKTNKKMYKFGLSAGAYIDFEIRIKKASLIQLSSAFVDLLNEIRLQIAHNQNSSTNDIQWIEVFSKLPDYLNLLLNSKKVHGKAQKFLAVFFQVVDFYDLSIHAELAFGGSASLKAAAGIKAAIDVKAILALTFDRQILNENVWIYDQEEFNQLKELTHQIKNLIDNSEEMKKVFYLI